MNKKEELIKHIKDTIKIIEKNKEEINEKEAYQLGLEEGSIIAYEDILKMLEEEE